MKNNDNNSFNLMVLSAYITKSSRNGKNMHCSITADVKERLPFHEHPPHELVVCLSDTGQLEINNKINIKINNYKVGRTFLIPSGVNHRIIGSTEHVARTQFICFDDDFASSLGIFSLKNYLSGKYLKHSLCSRFNEQSFKENTTFARCLQKEIDTPTLFADVMVKSFLTQLLINHCRLTTIPALIKSSSKAFEIERCCESILQDPSKPITLENMAKKAGMSRSSFALQFKAVTGKSLIEYTNLIRLQLACQQLTSTALSATHIAYECGFGNLGHFYNSFKKQYDLTPVDYRKWALEQQTGNNEASKTHYSS